MWPSLSPESPLQGAGEETGFSAQEEVESSFLQRVVGSEKIRLKGLFAQRKKENKLRFFKASLEGSEEHSPLSNFRCSERDLEFRALMFLGRVLCESLFLP